MYSRPIKIYTGINNPIKIICLNDDEKLIDVSGLSIQINVFEPNTQCLLISKMVTPNLSLGIGSVQIGFSDLAGLAPGQYELGVTATDANNNVTTLYVDGNYTSRLPLILQGGPSGVNNAPINLTFTTANTANSITSQIIDAALAPANDTTFSLQANLSNYTGNIFWVGTTITNPTLPLPNGGVTYVLPIIPMVPKATLYFVNGMKRIYGTDYIISSNSLLNLEEYPPDIGDVHELYCPIVLPASLHPPNGSTNYMIPFTPQFPSASLYFVNGIKRIYGIYYTITGNMLNIMGDPIIPQVGDTHELYCS